MIYLIGSLRNPNIPRVGDKIRALGIDVFDQWHAAGPEADDSWRDYHKERGNGYLVALNSPEADNIFDFDVRHLDASARAIVVMPAGKSGFFEAGYMVGRGKRVDILFDQEPERYDVMMKFAYKSGGSIYFNEEDLVHELKKHSSDSKQADLWPQERSTWEPSTEPYERRSAMVGILRAVDYSSTSRYDDGTLENRAKQIQRAS